MEKGKQEDFLLEQKLRQIRKLLDEMQSGDLDFDQNVKLFTEGTNLIDACRKYLDDAEMRVKQLIERNGQEEEVDFE